MTEDEWLTCEDSRRVFGTVARHIGARRLRLALCACLRSPHVWSLLVAPASRRAVEAGEAFADGFTGRRELGLARVKANAATRGRRVRWSSPAAAHLATYVCWQDQNLVPFLHLPDDDLTRLRPPSAPLRDVSGNIFRPVTLPLSCLTPTVVALARAAYDERIMPHGHLDPERLAVLADALEEAGATGEVVEHLRQEGPHVRGCWTVDLVLGKG